MDDVIGFGSNGVVVASRQSAGKALKYWLPHVMRGSIVGDSRSLSLFKGFFLGRNRFRVKVRGARLSIKFFGEAFPLDQVNSFARKANVIIADVCITQDLESPRCKLYSILHSCHPWPLKNGVLEMELAGPPVYLRLPLTYKEVNRLVAVLCEAAQSALLQGVAIVDLKPENICDAFNREGWIIVDVDDLPVVSDPQAYQSATYTVNTLANLGRGVQYFSFVNYLGPFEASSADLDGFYSEQHLRWSFSSKLPLDLSDHSLPTESTGHANALAAPPAVLDDPNRPHALCRRLAPAHALVVESNGTPDRTRGRAKLALCLRSGAAPRTCDPLLRRRRGR